MTVATPVAVAPSRRLFENGFPYWHELVLVVLLVGWLVYAGFTDPTFVQLNVQVELATHLWERAILALPMTLIIITAGIDLSVGSNLALCSVVMGVTAHAGAPMPIAILLALIVGLAGGLLNGLFISYV